MINILVVEDSEVVRNGITSLLNRQNDMNVLAAAKNGIEAIEMLEQSLEVDIVLADLNMPGMDGVSLTEEIQTLFPLVKVIILTMHVRAEFVDKAINAGAKGYLLKDGDFEDLYAGVRKVFEGETYISINL